MDWQNNLLLALYIIPAVIVMARRFYHGVQDFDDLWECSLDAFLCGLLWPYFAWTSLWDQI
jgi:hypothetical protein